MRDKCLKDYTGKNDKTKVATLTTFGRICNLKNDLARYGKVQIGISKTRAHFWQ